MIKIKLIIQLYINDIRHNMFNIKSKDDILINSLFILSLVYAFLFLAFKNELKVVFILSGLMVFYYIFQYKKKLFNTTPFYFLLMAIFIAMLTWILAKLQVPEIATNSPEIENLLDKFVFILFAIILFGNKNKTFIFWGVAALGAFLLPWLVGGGFEEIKLAILEKHRTGFGRHIITMGMIYSVIFIASLIFFHRFVYNSNKILNWLLWIAILTISILGIYSSQTRAIYLGLALIWFLVLIFIIYLFFTSRDKNRFIIVYFTILSTFFIIFGLLLLYYGAFDFLIKRATQEQSVISYLLAGEFDKIPKNSSGLRIHFWIDAWSWIVERPWTGWGKDGNISVHKEAGNFFGSRHFITIHNDILDILLQYGILGLLLFISLIVWLSNGVYKAWKNSTIEFDLILFYTLFLIFFLFNGMFLSTLFFHDTIFLWNIILAGYLGFIIKDKYINKLK